MFRDLISFCRLRTGGIVVRGVLFLALVVMLAPRDVAVRAQAASYTFPETGKTVKARFLEYWQERGGLAQQGYPISEEMQERSDTNGQTYTVQYFERAVFELHPENTSPNDVLLSLLGVFLYQQKYSKGAPSQTANTSEGSVLFKETGHRVGGKFLKYWQEHGALAQQGYPISEEFTEVSGLDGKSYLVQYFERAVFEMHPENAGTQYEVLLSQLGTFRYRGSYNSDGTPKAKEVDRDVFEGKRWKISNSKQALLEFIPIDTAELDKISQDLPPNVNAELFVAKDYNDAVAIAKAHNFDPKYFTNFGVQRPSDRHVFQIGQWWEKDGSPGPAILYFNSSQNIKDSEAMDNIKYTVIGNMFNRSFDNFESYIAFLQHAPTLKIFRDNIRIQNNIKP